MVTENIHHAASGPTVFIAEHDWEVVLLKERVVAALAETGAVHCIGLQPVAYNAFRNLGVANVHRSTPFLSAVRHTDMGLASARMIQAFAASVPSETAASFKIHSHDFLPSMAYLMCSPVNYFIVMIGLIDGIIEGLKPGRVVAVSSSYPRVEGLDLAPSFRALGDLLKRQLATTGIAVELIAHDDRTPFSDSKSFKPVRGFYPWKKLLHGLLLPLVSGGLDDQFWRLIEGQHIRHAARLQRWFGKPKATKPTFYMFLSSALMIGRRGGKELDRRGISVRRLVPVIPARAHVTEGASAALEVSEKIALSWRTWADTDPHWGRAMIYEGVDFSDLMRPVLDNVFTDFSFDSAYCYDAGADLARQSGSLGVGCVFELEYRYYWMARAFDDAGLASVHMSHALVIPSSDHGEALRPGWTIHSKHYLAPGQGFLPFFSKTGLSKAEHNYVTGVPGFRTTFVRPVGVRAWLARKLLGLESGGKVILATAYAEPEAGRSYRPDVQETNDEALDWINDLLDVIEGMEDCQLILKFRAFQTDPELFCRIEKLGRRVRVFGGEVSIHDLYGLADAAIALNSSAAVESVLADIPTVIYNPIGRPMYNDRWCRGQGDPDINIFELATNKESLLQILEEWKSDGAGPEYRRQMARVDPFFINNRDGGAAVRVAEVIAGLAPRL